MKFLLYTFLVTGIAALVCIFPILYLESQGKPQSPYHMIQLLCCFVCFLSSCSFIWSTRGNGFSTAKALAIVASLLSGGWVGFFVYVMVKMAQAGAWKELHYKLLSFKEPLATSCFFNHSVYSCKPLSGGFEITGEVEFEAISSTFNKLFDNLIGFM